MIKEVFLSFIIGVICLFVINFIGQFIDFYIPINWWTICLIGLLRLPGFLLILIIMII